MLVVALMLPLRGFAAIAMACAADAEPVSAVAADIHAGHQGMAEPHGTLLQLDAHHHHDHVSHHAHPGHCSNCCCTAMVPVTALRWMTPRSITVELAAPALPTPLAVTLDGVERPPRAHVG